MLNFLLIDGTETAQDPIGAKLVIPAIIIIVIAIGIFFLAIKGKGNSNGIGKKVIPLDATGTVNPNYSTITVFLEENDHHTTRYLTEHRFTADSLCKDGTKTIGAASQYETKKKFTIPTAYINIQGRLTQVDTGVAENHLTLDYDEQKSVFVLKSIEPHNIIVDNVAVERIELRAGDKKTVYLTGADAEKPARIKLEVFINRASCASHENMEHADHDIQPDYNADYNTI